MYAPVLRISTSFWVLRAPKSCLNYFFQLFSTFFVHFRKSSLNSLHEPKSTCTHFEKYISIHIACNIFLDFEITKIDTKRKQGKEGKKQDRIEDRIEDTHSQ